MNNESIANNRNLQINAQMYDSRPENPVLGRKFHVESEFEVKNKQIRRPGAKIKKNYLRKIISKFVFSLLKPFKTFQKGEINQSARGRRRLCFGFGGDFRVVFGQFSGRIFRNKNSKIHSKGL